MNQYTFGKTPAAQYLTRRLVELNNMQLTRACGVRVKTFNENVNAIMNSNMPVKVRANLLRLLRIDATQIVLDPSLEDSAFVSQLLRNVIIGNIKQGIRKVTTVRKIETASTNYRTLEAKAHKNLGPAGTKFYSVLGYHIAALNEYGDIDVELYQPNDIVDPTTPELLMERSDRRCLRQNKPHMQEYVNPTSI